MDPKGSYWWSVVTGLGNDKVVSGEQAITWANYDQDLSPNMASLGII